ncbi:MAG: prepilin-type N-terminal cleavage/methylation domain-containing protein [Planctomycetota bacterium]|nr:prepilin-type N-terminal cleavage/methylation domain-containing protein [Planctomycetota bacterium]
MTSTSRPRRRRGFSLIELVIVIAILGILAGVVTPRVSQRVAAARDARRLQDVQAIRDAVEQYYLDTGSYPTATSNATYGGWDVSHDGGFLDVLVRAGYLRSAPVDPLNDDTYHYRYYVYGASSYGCVGTAPFYVLGIRRFETTEVASKNTGYFQCTGRNWGQEFAYVTGGGASYQ